EDISCDCATIDLPDTLVSLRDLFPILREVPPSTASPTPSSLFAVKEPVSPSQDQIMVCTTSGRGTTSEENTSSWESQNPQEGHYSEPEYEYCSEPDSEQPEFKEGPLGSQRSYNLPSDDEEGEILEGLTLSTHPFYRGHQYPPPPPLVPPEDVELPPSLPSSSSTSSSSMAAVVPAPTPKEKGRRPDPFTQKSGYEKFRQQLSLFFQMNEEAQNFIEKVKAQATAGVIPVAAWGTWEEFATTLKTSFADPNKGKNSYNALEELTYSSGRSADEFLQEFETLAGRAGYMGATPNDAHLIVLLEQKVPIRLLDKVYNDVVPTTYADYKEKIIRYDNLGQKLKAIAPRKYGKLHFTSSSGITYAKTPTGIKVEETTAEIGRTRPKGKKLWRPRPSTSQPSTSRKPETSNVTCYGCGKKGHMREESDKRFSLNLEEHAAPLDDDSLVLPRNQSDVPSPHATHSTDTTSAFNTCTYITLNTIDFPTSTKPAPAETNRRTNEHKPQGPSPLEEEPKEPGTLEDALPSEKTKAMALALHIGLERTSITKDLVEGIPSTFTEDANSSQLADETSMDTRDWSSLTTSKLKNFGQSDNSMDIEQSLKDTERTRRLDDALRRTIGSSQGNDELNAIETRRISERRAGKQRQSNPISLIHTQLNTIVEEEDFAVDNNVLKSPNVET
ncbi:hypothetical protein PILCRDRAFT_8599, partial [Piloderma croceum F 1598]